MVLTGVDQLWRADITYIRLREEFVFLAVGWSPGLRQTVKTLATVR
jgi:hypothetical protein